MSLNPKESPRSGNPLSGKEKVLGAVISKEGYAENLLSHERTHHYRYL